MRAVFHLHPYVSFVYFISIIVFSVCILHPVCILLTFLGALFFLIKTEGVKALKFYLKFILPTAILAAVLNPLFNHRGVTILTYLPTGNPLTLESLLYGVAVSGMLASVMGWFYSFNHIMTSDKIVYLFGRVAPSLSLLLSMTFRIVPKFKRQITEISEAQKGLNILHQSKWKAGVTVLSTGTTALLENVVETADSMKSRGYGTRKRSFYSNYKLCKKDRIFLFAEVVLLLSLIYTWWHGRYDVVYYPAIEVETISMLGMILYGMFCFLPFITEVVEEIRWNVLQLKI